MKSLHDLSDEAFASLVRQAVALPDAPPDAVRRAIGLWRAPAPGLARQAIDAVLRRVVASLSFDSWAAAPLAAGVRGSGGDVRHLLFSAMGRDIDLRIVAQDDRFTLAGQVLGPDESGTVELRALGEAAAEDGAWRAELDDLGEFRIGSLPAGRYAMTLRMGDDAIEVSPLEVHTR